MIGDGVKVERSVESDLEAGRVAEALTLGESIGIIWRGACADGEGIERKASVDMEITEVGVACLLMLRGSRRGARGLWRLVISRPLSYAAGKDES